MHSVKYNIEVYPSHENILELSKQMTTKSLGGFMASQSLLVFVQSLMANLICYRPDKNVNFFVLIPVFSFDSE